jgi:hypothetical protein
MTIRAVRWIPWAAVRTALIAARELPLSTTYHAFGQHVSFFQLAGRMLGRSVTVRASMQRIVKIAMPVAALGGGAETA